MYIQRHKVTLSFPVGNHTNKFMQLAHLVRGCVCGTLNASAGIGKMRMRHVRCNAKPLLHKRFYVTDVTTANLANSHFRLKLPKKEKKKRRKQELAEIVA